MISLVPRSFLYFLPLHVGAEVIIGIGIFNKASGFYGILSIFTGHPISALEWLLNLISLALLPIYIMAFLNISKKNGLRTLLFAYVYCVDTLLSILFTILFSVRWFAETSTTATASGTLSTIESIVSNTLGDDSIPTSTVLEGMAFAAETATETFSEIATATSSLASEIINSVISATSTSLSSSVASAVPTPDEFNDYVYLAKRAAADAPILNKSASLAQETSETIVITVGLIMVRIYFCLVMIGYARMLVRQQNLRSHNGQPKGSWSAKFQYLALSIAEPFWTGNPYANNFRSGSPSQLKDESALHLNADFNDDNNN